jgi:bile acid-coenzyme A ligase
MGVRQGDLVTIGLTNGHEFFASCFAVWKLGAIPQPLSAALPARERQAIVDLADSRLVVGVAPGTHGDRICVEPGFEPEFSLSAEPLPDVVPPAWKAPTSGGSTGRPKIIVSTQPGVSDDRVARLLGIYSNDCQLIAGPLYHNGPFLFAMLGLFQGNHLIVLPRFDATTALVAIDEHSVDLAMVVPTMMKRMLDVYEGSPESYQLGSLRRLWHMASACPEWLKRKWIDLLGPDRVFELYGGTEGHAVTIIDGNEWLEHPGSVGRPALGEMVIMSDDGRPLSAGVIGEVYMRPLRKTPTYRYIGAKARTIGDWESIGDLGWMDDEGYLYIADRRKDLILRGGANVYPAEVEAALSEHAEVSSCAVVGTPDEDLGQRVHAIVQVRGPVGASELEAHMTQRLARYKVPESWEFVDHPVRDDAGKVRRSELAQHAQSNVAVSNHEPSESGSSH